MKSVFDHDFAYLIGNFMADGSFYISGKDPRFEFVDGSPYENELIFSLKHIQRIRKTLELFLDIKLPKIIKKKNKFILKFRNKKLAGLFVEKFGFSPGKKYKTINIPHFYLNSDYEKDFWIGFLDGDGSIARKSRKLSLESMSNLIIESFSTYLNKNNIFFSKYISKRGNDQSYVIVIKSVSFRDFASKIGFRHPLKSKLLFEKLKDKDFYTENELSKVRKNDLINYVNFFDDSVFVEGGRKLLLKYGYNKSSRNNVKFNEIVLFFKSKGINDEKICMEIIKFRFKKSKGSVNSIKLPLRFNNSLIKIARFVRIRNGGITFSKRYIESFNGDYDDIIKTTSEIFDIEPKFTHKNEPIFCSGVLSDFFNKIINRINR